MIKIRAILIALIILLAGCESEPTFTFGFSDVTLGNKTVARLEKEGIWFRHETGGRITIYQKDKGLVEHVGAEVAEQIIPMGRSISVNKHMQKEILQKLNESGVKHEIESFGAELLPPNANELGISSEYIVFDEGHETLGFEVIERFQSSVSPEQYLQHE